MHHYSDTVPMFSNIVYCMTRVLLRVRQQIWNNKIDNISSRLEHQTLNTFSIDLCVFHIVLHVTCVYCDAFENIPEINLFNNSLYVHSLFLSLCLHLRFDYSKTFFFTLKFLFLACLVVLTCFASLQII